MLHAENKVTLPISKLDASGNEVLWNLQEVHKAQASTSWSLSVSAYSMLDSQLTITGYHGKAKPRISKPNFWTHTSRNGAFGRKIWKKWFNNQAMNRMESRLNRAPDVRPRAGSARYEMRRIEATKVDTRVARDNQSCYGISNMSPY